MSIIYLQKQIYTKCRLINLCKYLYVQLYRSITFDIKIRIFSVRLQYLNIYTGAEIIMYTITFQ